MARKKEHALSCFRTKRRCRVVFASKTKNYLLLALSGDEFFSYLAYLADILKALNQLNEKLEGPQSNIVVHNDTINAFMAKLKLWNK